MKALTICQPYASLIFGWPGLPPELIKRVENRSWSTGYRGPLLIHAGTSRAYLDNWNGSVPPHLPFGMILGRVDLAGCQTIESIRHAPDRSTIGWIKYHIHAEGPYCFLMRHPCELLRSIPYRGQQGIFEIPDQELADAEWSRQCRKCGCTATDACPGGCSWVEPDLCSRCSKGAKPQQNSNKEELIQFNCQCGQRLYALITRGQLLIFKTLVVQGRITNCPNCKKDFSRATAEDFYSGNWQ